MSWLDKNGEEIKIGDYIEDKEGRYKVVEWDGDLAIESENSIWKLDQFLVYDNCSSDATFLLVYFLSPRHFLYF